MTSMQLKVCAMARQGMTHREIAALIRCTPLAVERRIYRARKRLRRHGLELPIRRAQRSRWSVGRIDPSLIDAA